MVFNLIDRTLEILISLILLCIAVVVAFNVLYRLVFIFSLSWSDEVAQILLVWLTFLGSAVAMRSGSHYAFDYLVRALPKRIGHVFATLSRIIVIAATSLLIFWSAEVTIEIRCWVMPASGISRAWVYGACPVGLFFMLVYEIRALFNDNGGPATSL